MNPYHGFTTFGRKSAWVLGLSALGICFPLFSHATSNEYDLSLAGTQTLNVAGAYGYGGYNTAIISDFWRQPAGTGVFDPFLTLDANGQTSTGSNYIEQAYNADGFNQLYLDGLRPNWNTTLRVGDLSSLTIGTQDYYAFILDANEPGGSKSIISVDNIRVYTSATDTTSLVKDNISNLDNLGTLRWALNDPTRNASAFNITNWVKLDAAQENVFTNANGGSGQADMVVYIPKLAFGNAKSTDYVWFYNLNGVHYSIDRNLGATAGYEEWSAVRNLAPPPSAPDGASTAMLLGIALVGVAGVRRFSRRRA